MCLRCFSKVPNIDDCDYDFTYPVFHVRLQESTTFKLRSECHAQSQLYSTFFWKKAGEVESKITCIWQWIQIIMPCELLIPELHITFFITRSIFAWKFLAPFFKNGTFLFLAESKECLQRSHLRITSSASIIKLTQEMLHNMIYNLCTILRFTCLACVGVQAIQESCLDWPLFIKCIRLGHEVVFLYSLRLRKSTKML